MVVLFILFVVQFSIACACLAFGADQQAELARRGWDSASLDNRHRAQTYFDCCGFNQTNAIEKLTSKDCPNVSLISIRFRITDGFLQQQVKCCTDKDNCSHDCDVCGPHIRTAIANALEISGE